MQRVFVFGNETPESACLGNKQLCICFLHQIIHKTGDRSGPLPQPPDHYARNHWLRQTDELGPEQLVARGETRGEELAESRLATSFAVGVFFSVNTRPRAERGTQIQWHMVHAHILVDRDLSRLCGSDPQIPESELQSVNAKTEGKKGHSNFGCGAECLERFGALARRPRKRRAVGD